MSLTIYYFITTLVSFLMFIIFLPVALEVYKKDPNEAPGIYNIKDAGYLFFVMSILAIPVFLYFFWNLSTELWILPYINKYHTYSA